MFLLISSRYMLEHSETMAENRWQTSNRCPFRTSEYFTKNPLFIRTLGMLARVSLGLGASRITNDVFGTNFGHKRVDSTILQQMERNHTHTISQRIVSNNIICRSLRTADDVNTHAVAVRQSASQSERRLNTLNEGQRWFSTSSMNCGEIDFRKMVRVRQTISGRRQSRLYVLCMEHGNGIVHLISPTERSRTERYRVSNSLMMLLLLLVCTIHSFTNRRWHQMSQMNRDIRRNARKRLNSMDKQICSLPIDRLALSFSLSGQQILIFFCRKKKKNRTFVSMNHVKYCVWPLPSHIANGMATSMVLTMTMLMAIEAERSTRARKVRLIFIYWISCETKKKIQRLSMMD